MLLKLGINSQFVAYYQLRKPSFLLINGSAAMATLLKLMEPHV